jgi:regulator of CtrA degradation
MSPVNPIKGTPDIETRVADFAGSEMFRRLFREGMDLVEETATYLDGPGRDDAKRLGRTGALS